MEKFLGQVEIMNKEDLEKKFPNLEEEAYKESLCGFAEKIFTEENSVGFGMTAEVYKYPDVETGLCFKHVYNLLPGNHDVDIEAEYMSAVAKNNTTKVRVPEPFATIVSPMKLRKDEHGNKVLSKDRVLVMEYMNAHTLQEFKNEGIALPENFNPALFFDELEAFIRQMNENKIYHRDLHDKNVMIDMETGLPVAIDYGRSYKSYLSDESDLDIYTSEEFFNGKSVKVVYLNDMDSVQKLRKEYQDYLTK